jgi:ABC-type transport system involved in multi-copper enzyme maturation permease subunit
MMRSAPVSRTGLVTGRLVALLVGSAVITLVATGALAAVAVSVGSPLDAAGTGRVALISLLFTAALGSFAAFVSAVVRSSTAVIALAMLVGASYLLSFLVPLFGWPAWLNRFSLFWAFGTPYAGWPSTAQMVTLLVATVSGTVAAMLVAERGSTVP